MRTLLFAFMGFCLGATIYGASPRRALVRVLGLRHGAGQASAPRITSNYGWRTDPVDPRRGKRWHDGVDLAQARGTAARSRFGAGIVSAVGSGGGLGNWVEVDYGDRRATYAHLDRTLVWRGKALSTDEIIGLSGSTGRSTGPHLHIQVRDQTGRSVDPQPLLAALR